MTTGRPTNALKIRQLTNELQETKTQLRSTQEEMDEVVRTNDNLVANCSDLRDIIRERDGTIQELRIQIEKEKERRNAEREKYIAEVGKHVAMGHAYKDAIRESSRGFAEGSL